MTEYFIFYLNKFVPHAYQFIGGPSGDELYPATEDGTRTWICVNAPSPATAIAKFVEQQANEVGPLGPCDLVAISVDSFNEVHYDGYKESEEVYEI